MRDITRKSCSTTCAHLPIRAVRTSPATPRVLNLSPPQKLIGAVHECDKGRVPLLLSRTQSTKSLFESSGSVALPGAPTEGMEDLRQQLAELRTRVRNSTDAAMAQQSPCWVVLAD